MDSSEIFQPRIKKIWWVDVVFYFAISLLIATVFCFLIFLTKNNFQKEDIKEQTTALQTVGTDQQREHEKEALNYRNKINDFTRLLRSHEFASNVFAFLHTQTMPNIWFSQFSLDEKNSAVQLSGESDDMDAFSRQVAIFEKNKYVKSIGTLNSSLAGSAKVDFNISLTLDKEIFSYLSNISLALENTTPTEEPSDQQEASEQENSQALTGNLSGEKLITAFHLLLEPEVVGLVDEVNHTITLNVPYGTDVKNLTPSIVISPEATVLPASNMSQDFTNPTTYRVVAQDGSVQSYQVKVAISAPAESSKKSSQSGSGASIVIILIGAVSVIAAASLFIWKKIKGQKAKLQQ